MAEKRIKLIKGAKISIGAKLTLSVLAIAAILLVSCVISVMEYTRMNDYVSTLIAEDIEYINEANQLADMCSEYNLEILSVIGDDISQNIPHFDNRTFKEHCLLIPGSEELLYSYSAYMLTSMELEDVMGSDFIDTRTWYYERLQPRYQRLHQDFKELAEGIHTQLLKNSATYDRGFYRSMVPGIVAVGVGILLLMMLLFFVLAYYVKPLDGMRDALKAYRNSDKKYTFTFDGDDELSELNADIAEITADDQMLRKRISALKNRTAREQN